MRSLIVLLVFAVVALLFALHATLREREPTAPPNPESHVGGVWERREGQSRRQQQH